MRKSKTAWLVVFALVVMLLCGVLAGCKKSGGGVGAGTDGSGSNGGSMTEIRTNTHVTFGLDSALESHQVAQGVKVTAIDATQSVADVEVSPRGKGFVVHPPAGGYTVGKTYIIEVGEGISFTEYPNVKRVKFTIVEELQVAFKDGVREYAESAVSSFQQHSIDANGSAYGSMTLQTNGVEIAPGDVFLVRKGDVSEAFKVQSANALSSSVTAISWIKPELTDVMTTMQFAGSADLSTEGGNAEISYKEAAEEELGKSELATSVLSIFGSKPTFNVNANIVDKKSVVATVTITVPNVVAVEGFGSTNLIITIKNTLTPTADTNFDFSAGQLKFNVDALIDNRTECIVTLGTSAGVDRISNVQELLDKLAALDASNEEGVSVPLFKWTVPIANGAAAISYDANLAFRFSFSGSFNVVAKGSILYNVGVAYDLENGITSYADSLKENFMDSVTVDMTGSATVKVGLIQDLSLEVLAGVLGVGISAEVGNYNSVYGVAQTGNLLVEAPTINGNIYFEGGIYYDVNLKFALKIGSIINLNQGVNIVNGQKRLYDAGQEFYATKLNALDNNRIALGAFVSNMPTFTKDVYCMTNGATDEGVAVDVADLRFTTDSAAITIDANGIVTIADAYRNQPFSATVNVELVGGIGMTSDAKAIYMQSVTFDYTGALVLATDRVAFDKSASSKTAIKVGVTLAGEAAGTTPTVEGIVGDYTWTGSELVLSVGALNRMDNGINELTVVAGNAQAKLTVDVTGRLAYNSDEKNGVYELYSKDQILDMIDRSANIDFAGKQFILTDDIDMGGAEIAPIAKFAGVLDGKGYAISNYTVTGAVDGNAAFIAVNTGVVTDIELAGNVALNVAAKHGQDFLVAGAVAVNNGIVTDVKVSGEVSVYSTSLAAFNEFRVAALVAQGEASGSAQDVAVQVRFKFDLLNVKFIVDADAYRASCDTVSNFNCTKVVKA